MNIRKNFVNLYLAILIALYAGTSCVVYYSYNWSGMQKCRRMPAQEQRENQNMAQYSDLLLSEETLKAVERMGFTEIGRAHV